MYNSRVSNLYPPPVTTDDPITNPIDGALVVSGAVVQFPQPFDPNTRYLTLDVQENDVRVRLSGADPTASLGHLLYAGSTYTWDVNTAKNARFIAAGGDATLFFTELTD